jgi:HJR/Mrr/RecB family endonuclease
MGRLLQKLWIGCCEVAAICGAWVLVKHLAWQYTAIIGCSILYAWWLAGSYGRTGIKQFQYRKVDVSKLTPLEYEEYCAVLLRGAGWRANTTPRQDQGADVLAVLRRTKAVIQCKMYASPVGNRAVQEAIAGRAFYKTHLAVVVSTAPYTRSARQLAARTEVLLLHHDQLPNLEKLARLR